MRQSSHTKENPWIPHTSDDWRLAQQRAKNWSGLSAYPWWEDPRISLTPSDYHHYLESQCAGRGDAFLKKAQRIGQQHAEW